VRSLLWIVLWALSGCAHAGRVEGCGEPMRTPRVLPDGAEARLSIHGAVPGLELLVTTSAPPRGSVCVVDSRKHLTGAAAFREGQARLSPPDPTQLAILAMLTLESGVAGMAPWTDPASLGGRSPKVGAAPPSLEGGTLRYWRPHAQTADLVWVELNLDTLTLTARAEAELAQAGQDAVTKAEALLVSDDATVRVGAVGVLARSGEPLAFTRLAQVALTDPAPLVRKEAARQLGEKAPPGAATTLAQLLAQDPSPDVRSAAATALGRAGGPEARAALEQAAANDADAGVRSQARAALARLGG